MQTIALCWLIGMLCPASVSAQSHAAAPGVIINEIPAPDWQWWKEEFVSDPAILVLSNGDYLASHARFGDGTNSSSSGRTEVFRSSDQGQTWTKVNGGNDLNGILRASLFEHDGAVYLSGSTHDAAGNKWVMMRSTDGGDTWTSQTFTAGGFATPDNLVTHAGRSWLTSTRSSVFLSTNDDPYQEVSWTRRGGFPSPQDSWLGGSYSVANNFIGEGQTAASPQLVELQTSFFMGN